MKKNSLFFNAYVVFYALFYFNFGYSQPRLVITDGTYINIGGNGVSNPVYLTINNTNTNAVTQSGSGTGCIISENEYSYINWIIKTGTGNYFFPTGTSSYFIPVYVNVGSAGSGDGNLMVSTWYTADNATVPDSGYNICSNEGRAIDRFWKVLYRSYSANPTASVKFYYNTAELDGISESDLVAQSGNTSLSCPWNSPTGTVNTSSDYVEVTSVSTSVPWVLSNNNTPLPIELIKFNVYWKSNLKNVAIIKWTTATEINNDYFEVERSSDSMHFKTIARVKGAGNSVQLIDYLFEDTNPLKDENSYYRLKQTDFNGKFSYSNIVNLKRTDELNNIDFVSVFPNPANAYLLLKINTALNQNYEYKIYDYSGKICFTGYIDLKSDINPKMLNVSNLSKGVYSIRIKSNSFNHEIHKKFIKQ